MGIWKMTTNFYDNVTLNNFASPFTELFSFLKRYADNGLFITHYKPEELKLMRQHIDNAVEGLLHGLQGIGCILSSLANDHLKMIKNIGFFISIISNLMEALNALKLDTEYVLNERKLI